MHRDLVASLTLARTRGVGPITYRQLVARFGSAPAALAALPDIVRRGGGSLVPVNAGEIEREIAAVDRLGARYMLIESADYPPLLKLTDAAPPVLIAQGNGALTGQPAIAIVGARNASAAACAFARRLACDLGEAGQVIVSGLARGIDSAAHMGAIDSGTIGVIGHGHDHCFPPQNAALQKRIADQHLLLSEYPPGVEPLARHFPHRNRIIAGICAATVVVEAAPKSGSLLTARLAAEAGRDVMAVPGSPLDPRARGCNQLIREGATLIESADDVLEMLRTFDSPQLRSPPAYAALPSAAESEAGDGGSAVAQSDDIAEADRKAIAALLGPVAVSCDELVRQSGLATSAVQTILLELELAGRVTTHAGGRVTMTS